MKYLVEVRLGWGEDVKAKPTFANSAAPSATSTPNPIVFRADLPDEYLKVIPNDWPYSGMYVCMNSSLLDMTGFLVPLDVSHYIIWSRVPAISSSNIPVAIQAFVKEYGLWGFTGTDEAIPPPDIEPKVSMTESEKSFFAEACREFDIFVKRRWPKDAWECAWFVNPPVRSTERDRWAIFR